MYDFWVTTFNPGIKLFHLEEKIFKVDQQVAHLQSSQLVSIRMVMIGLMTAYISAVPWAHLH